LLLSWQIWLQPPPHICRTVIHPPTKSMYNHVKKDKLIMYLFCCVLTLKRLWFSSFSWMLSVAFFLNRNTEFSYCNRMILQYSNKTTNPSPPPYYCFIKGWGSFKLHKRFYKYYLPMTHVSRCCWFATCLVIKILSTNLSYPSCMLPIISLSIVFPLLSPPT